MKYLPDWSPDTIEKVEGMLNKKFTVFEWGTGYSTIWLAHRSGQVITMEHTQEWYDKIRRIARDMFLYNIDFNLFALHDERYFTHIHNTGGIDLIIIDGRERVKCFREAYKHDCPIIMLDDSERDRYKEAFSYQLDYTDTLPNTQGQKATIFYK